MSKDALTLLKSFDILQGLKSSELSALYSRMKTLTFSKGKSLFHEGDRGEEMYIILSGSVAITVLTPDKKVLELAEIGEGSFFGEMSIFDRAARSATCTPKNETRVLSLKADDFYEYIEEYPLAGIGIMHRMLNITTSRLQTTGAFLSDMVTWGEQARKRAITDDFTGLYNRRFLDEVLPGRLAEAREKKQPLSLLMIDLDHFGTLNQLYGQEWGDKIILQAVKVFRCIFDSQSILSRYGGDEFFFLLPGQDSQSAWEKCDKMVKEIRRIHLGVPSKGRIDKVSVSVGISSFPEHGDKHETLLERADQALYRAKEAGRDQAVVWTGRKETKSSIDNIKERNRIIRRILDLISEGNRFLVMGHKQPDEDCISSMIAMSLLIRNFFKKVSLVIPRKINSKFQHMINICRYNFIDIVYSDEVPPKKISALFVLDTPKPSMMEDFIGLDDILKSDTIPVVEIDHHLEADSAYIGDENYRLVDVASSACELVALIAYKMNSAKDLREQYQIGEVFSRNFVLSVLTGIIGDTHMGKYLKSKREKWFYHLFSNLFNEMLVQKTHQNSRNLSTMKEVFTELQKLSEQEDACYQFMMQHQNQFTSRVKQVIVPLNKAEEFNRNFDHETIVAVARFTADVLSESSGYLSLVAYYDDPRTSDLIQFRVRRNHHYHKLDLREILKDFNIENGGGHPGAIGFRIPREEISDIIQYCEALSQGMERAMDLAE